MACGPGNSVPWGCGIGWTIPCNPMIPWDRGMGWTIYGISGQPFLILLYSRPSVIQTPFLGIIMIFIGIVLCIK